MNLVRQMTACALAVAIPGVAVAAPVFQPNSNHYADRNPSAVTGRSGSASLASRALLGKDGKTTVDVTTGTIGAATAPGQISKLQFKGLRSDGTAAFTLNYSGMTTAIQSYTLNGLTRGQPLQVQGNVRGIDGKRTDVVTISDTTRLRPDLAAGVSAADKAKINTLVGITGKITEANGDSGATTDCVLYVDGVEADRANGIWVDSGDEISCAFTYQFTTLGSHELKVTAANVNPGDWDLANNTATKSIEIVAAETKMNYWFQASEQNYHYYYHYTGSYRYSDGTYAETSDWDNENLQDQMYQNVYMNTWSNQTATFPLTVTGAESSDGVATVSNAVTFAAADWSYNSGSYNQACGYRYTDGLYVYICSGDSNGQGWTNVSYQRYSGKVTYYSKNWSYYWSTWNGSYSYSYNYSYGYSYGQSAPAFGNTSGLKLTIDSGAGTQTATANASLTDYDYYWYWYNYSYPMSCWDYSGTYYTQHYCSEYNYSNKYRYGYDSDYSQQ